MSALSTFDSTVNSVYLAFFGRPADPAGLAFWSKQLAENNGDLRAITPFFASSEEAQVRFGTDTVTSRIGEIYEQLFNRTPDAAGLAFWANAVEQGHATLADVSIAILNGAQGTDQTLSSLRQQAADAFTASVDASGSAYSGYASIEAARVLVRAVTLDATAADLDALVKAGVSFADTATKTPQVVEAIATGSTLLGLFDTTRGTADPVALAQALADTAKAAAGDPVTLASLLRGGGMAQVLKVMPANATLKDVVKALAEGGLPAAVEVVYPTKPATPVTNLKLAFDSVTQGEGDSHVDNVTREKDVVVKFTYTGNDLRAGQSFQYSVDGVHWSEKYLKVDTATNTVTISDVWLAGVDSQQQGITLMEHIPAADLITKFQLRAVDASDRVLASATQDLVYDRAAPAGWLSFNKIEDTDSGDNTTTNDHARVTFDIEGDQEDAIVQWRVQGDDAWATFDRDAFNDKGSFTIDVDLSENDQTLEVRLIDAAGNVGDAIEQFIDGPASSEPTFDFKLSDRGVEFGTDTVGKLSIFNANDKTSSPLDTTNGTSDIGIGYSTIGVQTKAVSGVVQFTSNGTVTTLAPTTVGFGSSGNDALSGRAVWGYDGDDKISGTIDGDSLFGGDGNDTISGGAGNDLIMGGLGGDLIDLGGDLDFDGVLYAKGDADSGVFSDGGSIAAIDKISHFNQNDVIRTNADFGNKPSVQSTYLSGNDEAAVAVVRGTSVGNTFVAGTGVSDDDYMVQWIDDKTVNSVIVQNYGVNAPQVELGLDGEIAFYQPVVIPLAAIGFALTNTPSTVVFTAVSGDVVSLDNVDGFTLNSFGRGGPVATVHDYTATPGFFMEFGNLHFDGVLAAGLYQMSWANDTFSAGDGHLAAGVQLFAGGQDGVFGHSGIAVGFSVEVQGGLFASDSDVYSEAFIGASIDAYLHTGGGYDVVIDGASKLTLEYTELNSTSQDLIIGFDQGEDVIQFEGDAAKLIDRDSSGGIDWFINPSNGVVGADAEGVIVTVSGPVMVGPNTDDFFVLDTLNHDLKLLAIAQGDGLLILANGGIGNDDAGVLFYYENKDGNGAIDADELTTVAMFSDGVAGFEDIIVVGTQVIAPPPP